MKPDHVDTQIAKYFCIVLELCALKPTETVLIFTDVNFPYPSYPIIALEAVRRIGAEGYILVSGEDQTLLDRTIYAAWTHADLILGMSFLPGDYSWMYSDLHNDSLKAGARVLMIQEPPDVLIRMVPTPETIKRGMSGAELISEAKSIEILSLDGTNLIIKKEGRKGSFQCGFVDTPGRWDHWPSGMVYCAPLEDSATGTLVVCPEDAIIGMGLWEHTKSHIRYTFENGRITSIAGGEEARRIQEALEETRDDGSFRLAHVGWGSDPRADWNHVGMDSESFYENITIALGRNIFDAPHKHCGLGGKNRAKIHFDMCLLGKSLFLDGKCIIDQGQFTLAKLF